jgi:hypothetical protein
MEGIPYQTEAEFLQRREYGGWLARLAEQAEVAPAARLLVFPQKVPRAPGLPVVQEQPRKAKQKRRGGSGSGGAESFPGSHRGY